jgi:hypothetical protein
MYNCTFKLSGTSCSGFTTQINPQYCTNMNEIILQFKTALLYILKKHNLEVLFDEINNYPFDHHNYTFQDILQQNYKNKEQIFYICAHCSSSN